MHNVQHNGAGRITVHATLNRNPPTDGFLAHVAGRLFRSRRPPFLAELDGDLAAQARELASSAPPRVLYPLIGSVRLPGDVALVELPAGDAVYAERERSHLCVCALRAEGSSVTFRPVAGALLLPAAPTEADWQAVEAKEWAEDWDADSTWEAWAAENVLVVPLRGTTAPGEDEEARILSTCILPKLAMLALALSPIVDREPTAWVSWQRPPKG